MGGSQLLSVSKTFTEKEMKHETKEETLDHKVLSFLSSEGWGRASLVPRPLGTRLGTAGYILCALYALCMSVSVYVYRIRVQLTYVLL